MSENEGTFASLMELQEANAEPPTKGSKPLDKPPTTPALSPELDDLQAVGYRSHSFRFTTPESRWMNSECFHLSAKLDRPITHNTLIRVLLRIADDIMKKNPADNELLDRLLRIKD